MSIWNLNHLFHPQSIAVIGAFSRPHRVSETMLRNDIGGNFKGAIFPVNPKYRGHNRRAPNLASGPGFEIVPTDETGTMFLRLRLTTDAGATPT
jgi:acetyltransferase